MGKKDNKDNEMNAIEFLEAMAAELGVKTETLSIQDGIDETCRGVYMLYRGFQKAGFSEEQAWELIKTALNKN